MATAKYSIVLTIVLALLTQTNAEEESILGQIIKAASSVLTGNPLEALATILPSGENTECDDKNNKTAIDQIVGNATSSTTECPTTKCSSTKSPVSAILHIYNEPADHNAFNSLLLDAVENLDKLGLPKDSNPLDCLDVNNSNISSVSVADKVVDEILSLENSSGIYNSSLDAIINDTVSVVSPDTANSLLRDISNVTTGILGTVVSDSYVTDKQTNTEAIPDTITNIDDVIVPPTAQTTTKRPQGLIGAVTEKVTPHENLKDRQRINNINISKDKPADNPTDNEAINEAVKCLNTNIDQISKEAEKAVKEVAKETNKLMKKLTKLCNTAFDKD